MSDESQRGKAEGPRGGIKLEQFPRTSQGLQSSGFRASPPCPAILYVTIAQSGDSRAEKKGQVYLQAHG